MIRIKRRDRLRKGAGGSDVPKAGHHGARPAGIVEQSVLPQAGDGDPGPIQQRTDHSGRRKEMHRDARIGEKSGGVDCNLGLTAVHIGEIADDQRLRHALRHCALFLDGQWDIIK